MHYWKTQHLMKKNRPAVFSCYLAAINACFPLAYFFSERHHRKGCRHSPLKLHVHNLMMKRHTKSMVISIRERARTQLTEALTYSMNTSSICISIEKTHFDRCLRSDLLSPFYLIAADIVVTRVDAAAVWSRLQSLSHRLHIWAGVCTYDGHGPASVALAHQHKGNTYRWWCSVKTPSLCVKLWSFIPVWLCPGIFCM